MVFLLVPLSGFTQFSPNFIILCRTYQFCLTMKKNFLFYPVIFVLLVINADIKAQNNTAALDQTVLMRQFLGSWKAEIAPDTFIMTNYLPFGTSIDCNAKIYTKNQVLDSIKQIYGFDYSSHKFLAAEIVKSTSIIEFVAIWFTSPTSGREVYLRDISNFDKAVMKWTFEFKTPDTMIQSTFRNNKLVGTEILKRLKK